MKKNLIKMVLFFCGIIVFLSCTSNKRKDVIPPVTTLTNNPRNEFIIDGDGYSNDFVTVDTTISSVNDCSPSYNDLVFYQDSILLFYCCASTINGITTPFSMRLNSHFTGTGTYPFKGSNNTGFIIGLNNKAYMGDIGSMEIDTLNPAGYLSGTYSGTFVDMNNSSNIVNITGGKYIIRKDF